MEEAIGRDRLPIAVRENGIFKTEFLDDLAIVVDRINRDGYQLGSCRANVFDA